MKKKIKELALFLKRNKKSLYLSAVIFIAVFALSYFLPNVVFAQEAKPTDPNAYNASKTLAWLISYLVNLVVSVLGALITFLLYILVEIAKYNDFTNSAAIIYGWQVVIGICNMFFIVIMLVVAFSVILQIDGYDIKKMIPKLLVMAVLINFSKSICGLIIDAAQVVMLTFIHSVKGMGGSFVDLFGLKNLGTFSQNGSGLAAAGEMLTASALAVAFMLVALVVVVALLSILVMRIIMLWVYVVLSPLAFLLSTFPQGKSYANKWWSDFTENVLIGPILAFFLWLSFATLKNTTGSQLIGANSDNLTKNQPVSLTAMFESDNLIKFVVSIGMLVGGLTITQGMAGQLGKFAGKAMSRVNSGQAWVKRNTIDRASDTVKAGAVAAGGMALVAGKGGIGLADRLAGQTISSITGGKMKAFAERGVVGQVAAVTKAVPTQFMAKVKDRIDKNRTLNNNLYQAQFNKDRIVEHDNKKYKLNANKEYQRIDDNGNHVDPAKDPNAFLMKNGRKVVDKDLGNFAVRAWRGATFSASSQSHAVAEELENKKIEEARKKIKTSGMSTVEARRRLESAGTTAIDKKALAMHLADEKGFENIDQRKVAEKALGGNNTLVKKFGDTIIKNQVHLAYDLDAKDKSGNPDIAARARENDRLMKDLQKGNVDTRNLSKDAWANDALIDSIQSWAGDEKFAGIIKANAEAGGKKNRDNVAGYLGKKIDRKNLKTDKFAKMQARLTGDLSVSFNEISDGTGKVDQVALADFLSNAKAKDLEEVDASQIDKIYKSSGGSFATDLKKVIAKSVSYGQLKAILKSGNQDLARKLKNDILEVDNAIGGIAAAAEISKDSELNSL